MSNYSLELIEKQIKSILIVELSRIGILFRIFSRIKSAASISNKISNKSYSEGGKLMQDVIGFRITTYFIDDIEIVVNLCRKIFHTVELVYDEPNAELFKPMRKNMVCKFPEEQEICFSELQTNADGYKLVDATFEIQFRTTFSEGWHEVDHLMRYKCQQDWQHLERESRMLNGINASLETNDQALKALFDDISYHHYKEKRWEAMMRNKFRLNFRTDIMHKQIQRHLNENNEFAKNLFRLNRTKIIGAFVNSNLVFILTFDNWIFFVNHFFIKDETISQIAPTVLRDEFELVNQKNRLH